MKPVDDDIEHPLIGMTGCSFSEVPAPAPG
jgi:hypothetical protein